MVTRKMIETRVENLNKLFNLDMTVGYAYGRPRVENATGSRDISPRLRTGELYLWLDGFQVGLWEFANHQKKAKVEYQPKTGETCSCRKGVQRDNCPNCEGTGMKIDFRAIRQNNSEA